VASFQDIPVIDLRDTPDIVTAKFHQAYSTAGFGYIIGHGVQPDLIDAVFEASRRFHALELRTKMKTAVNAQHRGYIPINTSTDVTSTLATVTKPNQSASFMMMREDAAIDKDVYLSGPNQWPNLIGFRPALEAYNTAMSDLARRLMKIAFRAAGIPDDYLASSFAPATTWLRLLHYPPQAPQSAQDLYGSAPHTDFGCLTILAQDDVGGLQVQTPLGDWVDVPKLKDSFVVNVGDMLHRMSNGLLKSTPHRVINSSGRERYSCPFFYDPNVNTQIAPWTEGTPQYSPILFGDFLRSQLEASYEAHKPATNP